MISQIRNFLRDRYSLLDKSRVVFFTSVILILFLIKKIFIYFEGDYPVQSTPAWDSPFFTDRDVREIVRDYDGLDEENRGYVLSGLFNRPDVVDAIPKLIYISADEQESPNLRMLACQLLGSSSSARPAIPELINILCATPDGHLRQEMAKTLNNLAPWGSDSAPKISSSWHRMNVWNHSV